MSRYHLHVAESADGTTTFQTQEAAPESEAAATGAMLAGRGLVVWLYEHDHDAVEPDVYRELGMFIGDRFMSTRPTDGRSSNGHRLR